MWAIKPALHDAFKSLQPFGIWEEGGNDPEREPLHVLNELWNGDKHRAVALIAGAMKLTPEPPNGFVAQDIERFDWWPFEDNAPLLNFVIVREPNYLPAGNVEVHGKGPFGIAFEPGAPAYGAGVDDMLGLTYGLIHVILGQFRQYFTDGTIPDFRDRQRTAIGLVTSPFVRGG